MKRTLAIAAGLALSIMAVAAPASGHHRDSHCGGNTGPNLIVGTLGNNVLVGTRCDDVLLGLAGRDVLFGFAGEDILRGGNGRDILRAVDGEADRLNGGFGRDRCVGDSEDAFISCETVVIR